IRMNVLIPIGNQIFINYIQGLVMLLVVIYKFTNIIYSYFSELERKNNEK
ncbi:unnamed protein product, partial [marine sediment metagenome]